MRIVFGDKLDGGAWPPAPDGKALGFAAVGPAGLLAIVESCVGLTGPVIPAARRIAVMRRRMAALPGERFWSGSFEVDPWTVAREVLSWRDELVAAGWTAKAIDSAPSRLADLAALEAVAEPALPLGVSDRLVAAVDALRQEREISLEEVSVIDDEAAIAPGIRRLLNALAKIGVQVVYRPAEAGACKHNSDLAKAQAWLARAENVPLVGDGTFVVVRSHSEGAAADAVAEWLAAAREEQSTLAVLGDGTGVLDLALSRRGLPRFGHLAASPLRGAVQVLALAFATRWHPFNPSRLLDLISLPHSPIPKGVGNALARALVEAPGRDGPVWRQAIENGSQRRRETYKKRGFADAELERRVRRDLERWMPWISGALHDDASGIPIASAREVCALVSAWSARMAGDDQGPISAVGGFATTLSEVIAEAGIDPLPRVQLERMIDAVVAEGVGARHSVAEAASWSHVKAPDQVWGEANEVLWWGCRSGALSPQLETWDNEERAALAKAGCLPDDPARALARAAAGWRRAVLNAQDRVILVVPPEGEGQEAQHPLLHELSPILSDVGPGVEFSAERIFHEERIELAGRVISRVAVTPQELPAPRANWQIAKKAIRPRQTEAATSIELLLACPFAWSVTYAGNLHPSRQSEVPDGDRLLGILAHALAAELFQPGSPCSPEEARRRALERLPGLIEEMASPLRLPGAAADYSRALVRLPNAMAVLAEQLAKLNATVVGAEVDREVSDALVAGQVLKGRIDLLVETDGGRPAVIDMKWARTDKYRREDVESGRAVQLAVYGRIVSDAAEPAPGAYFMLSQARVLPAGASVFGSALSPSTPDLSTVWSNASTSWQERTRSLSDGKVRAVSENLALSSNEGAETSALQLDPPCKFCNKARLCGHARVS